MNLQNRTMQHFPIAPGGAGHGQLQDMRELYAATGGLLAACEVASVQDQRIGNGVGVVARWIVCRQVINVAWCGDYWLPRFQFSKDTMVPLAALHPIMAEINPLLDDWCLAAWFAKPNACLSGHPPAQLMLTAPDKVIDAARTYRFANRG